MVHRQKRKIESDLIEVISKLIRSELPDEHQLDLLSVTRVDVTPDMRQATVYVSHIKKDESLREGSLKLLRRHEKDLRAGITKALPLKHIPELRFREDTSIKEAQEINRIMSELKAERDARETDPET